MRWHRQKENLLSILTSEILSGELLILWQMGIFIPIRITEIWIKTTEIPVFSRCAQKD